MYRCQCRDCQIGQSSDVLLKEVVTVLTYLLVRTTISRPLKGPYRYILLCSLLFLCSLYACMFML